MKVSPASPQLLLTPQPPSSPYLRGLSSSSGLRMREGRPVTMSLLLHTQVENVAVSGHLNCRNLS
ncbi:hypothetical protein BD309DRAFT_952023 [Dichomitus squalens]|nr:hypothetical protein BD309DRAFT_952023 [Dichomitus squalens]